MPAPAPPDLRIPYDIDGTVVKTFRSGVYLGSISEANLVLLNNNQAATEITNSGSNQPSVTVSWMFPQPMTLTAFFGIITQPGSLGDAAVTPWAWSTDTTDGLDGTWTTIHGGGSVSVPGLTVASHGLQSGGVQEPNVRSPKVLGAPITGIKSVRLILTGNLVRRASLWSAAIYGHVTTPDWLEAWHPTLDQQIAAAGSDWGFHSKGTSAALPFRVKNCNDGATLHGVSLAINDASVDTPLAGATHYLSSDDAVYAPTVAVGDLSPNEISAIHYVKRVTPWNAVSGVYDLRIVPSITGLSG